MTSTHPQWLAPRPVRRPRLAASMRQALALIASPAAARGAAGAAHHPRVKGTSWPGLAAGRKRPRNLACACAKNSVSFRFGQVPESLQDGDNPCKNRVLARAGSIRRPPAKTKRNRNAQRSVTPGARTAARALAPGG